MNESQKEDLLKVIREEFRRILGNELDQIILFGSHARGESRSDSDLDILIVLNGEVNLTRLLRQTSDAIARLSLENDIVISRAFISKERFENEISPFILNIRREGIVI
jgi:predicted nucleotidyltransferase